MSATLGALLRLVEPDWSITLIERLDGAAAESSDPWNNAGTGHAGLCELNYTPERPDGSIDISKAVQVNEQFQVTRQFWAYAVENGLLPDVRSFLNPIPHVSFVNGAARHRLLEAPPRRAGRQSVVRVDGVHRRRRRVRPAVAADGRQTRLRRSDRAGLGAGRHRRRLRGAVATAHRLHGAARHDHAVRSRGARPAQAIRRQLDADDRQPAHRGKAKAEREVRVHRGGRWHGAVAAEVRDPRRPRGSAASRSAARFLRTDSPALAAAHRAKVYGSCRSGAPSDGGSHLDARIINGKSWLLFGPFAGWSPKFLKQGNDHRSAVVGQAEQPGADGQRRAHAGGSGAVPDRPAAAVGVRSGAGTA